MSVTREDLQAFHRFADKKLRHGGARSLVDLAGEWEAQRREMEETVEAIRQSHSDIDAGRVSSVEDAFTDAREQLGLE